MGRTRSRRTLTALALTVAGVCALALPRAFAGDVNGDRPSQDERLAQVLNHLDIAKTRLADVNADWTAPPEGDEPELRALLADIMSSCASLDAHAKEIEAKLADR